MTVDPICATYVGVTGQHTINFFLLSKARGFLLDSRKAASARGDTRWPAAVLLWENACHPIVSVRTTPLTHHSRVRQSRRNRTHSALSPRSVCVPLDRRRCVRRCFRVHFADLLILVSRNTPGTPGVFCPIWTLAGSTFRCLTVQSAHSAGTTSQQLPRFGLAICGLWFSHRCHPQRRVPGR